MDFGVAPPASPFSSNETFSTPAGSSSDAYATQVQSPSVEVPVQSPARPVAQVAPKKKSKAIWVVAALAVLFVVGIVAAGAGWFVYSNYYAAANVAPTPEPTPVITPTPEPTLEAVTNLNSNTNTSTAELSTNSNSNTNSELSTVEPSPSPENDTAIRDTTESRQTQQADTRKTKPGKTNTPVAAKPTPKKPSRTDILQ
jgi:flagellar basal body-associated protein FliL